MLCARAVKLLNLQIRTLLPLGTVPRLREMMAACPIWSIGMQDRSRTR